MKQLYSDQSSLLHRSILLFLIAALLIGCGGQPEPTSTPTSSLLTGNIEPAPTASGVEAPPAVDATVARIGFQPDVHGFQFENYGNEYPNSDLTVNELRQMFGDVVCARIQNGNCVLKPNARLWMQEINNAMLGGHCEGMAVLSLAFFAGREDPVRYGGSPPFSLQPSAPLLRRIAYYWATQALDPVIMATIRGTPNDILAALQEAFVAGNELYTIGIYQEGVGGHAVTPYAISDQGGGIYWIHVYDNNFPGQEKHIEIDTNANTWTYALAALNPASDSAPWRGDASTLSLEITPLSIRDKPMPCPFCAETSSSASSDPNLFFNVAGQIGSSQISSSRSTIVAVSRSRAASVSDTQRSVSAPSIQPVVTTTNGQRVGVINGRIVNEVPGARVVRLRGVLYNNQPPLIILPAGLDVTISYTVSDPSVDQEHVSIGVFRPGTTFVIDGMQTRPGQQPEIQLTGKTSFAVKSNGPSQPRFWLGLDAKTNQLFQINSFAFDSQTTLQMQVDPDNGRLTVGGDQSASGSYNLMIATLDQAGERIFASSQISADGDLTFDFGAWTGSGPMNVFVDQDGDGQSEATLNLEDEGLASLLAGDADLSQAEAIALLEMVGEYASADEMVSLIEKGGIPVADLADLLSDLSPDAIVEIVDGLALSPEEKSQLLEELRQDEGSDGGDSDSGGGDNNSGGGDNNSGGGDNNSGGGDSDSGGG
ncbi:MAG: hypothetical protein SNJ65_16870, partial [Roseiflexus sp.]